MARQHPQGGRAMKTEALLTPHLIATLKPRSKEYTLHDAGCVGLALRVQPGGARSWVTWDRQGGKTRRITLGKVEALDLEAARTALRSRQAGLALPETPGTSPTFGALAQRFLEAKAGIYTPRTLSCLGAYLDSQLLPAFGAKRLHTITTPQVAEWFHRYARTRPGGANAALGHFTTIWRWGRDQGLFPGDLPNPAGPVRKMPRVARGQMLNAGDLRRLAAVLDTPPPRTRDAAEAIRIILFTGCRSGEILRLRWREVKSGRLTLERTKTGPRVVLLSDEASQLFKTRRGPRSSDYVFPSQSCPDRPRRSITSAWNHIKRAASLPPSLRLHDLRHTYASHAVLSGESLYLTGKLLGHRNPGSTNRYAHLDSH
ncbi:tyrosine-type recombinase/integrase, partial [Palleronia caenipelagi]